MHSLITIYTVEVKKMNDHSVDDYFQRLSFGYSLAIKYTKKELMRQLLADSDLYREWNSDPVIRLGFKLGLQDRDSRGRTKPEPPPSYTMKESSNQRKPIKR